MNAFSLFPKVEDIMTSRSSFICVDEKDVERADLIAEENNFDVIPLLYKGEIRNYWSHVEKRSMPITKRHRVSHDTPVEGALSRLNNHLVQFVHYRSEIVGLVDISDLNKPLARLAWLRPILECEQFLVTSVAAMKHPDVAVMKALGPAAASAKKRQQHAHRENLDLPLLSFAHFADLLKATTRLGVIRMSDGEITRLNALRNRLAHGGRTLVEKRSDGNELVWALDICRRLLATRGEN